MRAVLASTVAEKMFKGTAYISRWQILDEIGNPLALTGTETLIMRLARSFTEPTLLEITGTIVTPADGLVMFTFQPSDTEDLSARAYDRTVLVDGDVFAQDRFGIVAQNRGT